MEIAERHIVMFWNNGHAHSLDIGRTFKIICVVNSRYISQPYVSPNADFALAQRSCVGRKMEVWMEEHENKFFVRKFFGFRWKLTVSPSSV